MNVVCYKVKVSATGRSLVQNFYRMWCVCGVDYTTLRSSERAGSKIAILITQNVKSGQSAS
jgi:hypothetical protein